ncbi:DNA-binding protein H-NS [Paraburkholderia sp. EB58]|jgi:DNA-binding protein H-NS|uniref:H-NS family nucleoid-associated regulatory protein n=1 Tax=Paraburkholderia sp. EB58 TaxID=3035125 RepID=UPI003D257C5A
MATLEQIQNRLKKLQAQADALIAKKAQVVVDQIRELMLKHGLTTADIETGTTVRRAAKTAAVRKSGINAKAAKPAGVPKYLDAKTGATWTGHGRAPSWIAGAKDRTKFLAHGEVEAVSATAKKSAGAAKGAVRTGQPKGAQPAMYIDRKTGATWSGRGRAPAWLAKAKDRSKFLINPAVGTDAIGSKEEVTRKAIRKNAVAAKKIARKKLATVKKAVVKSVSAKEVRATAEGKRVVAKKAASRKAAASNPSPIENGAGALESPSGQIVA